MWLLQPAQVSVHNIFKQQSLFFLIKVCKIFRYGAIAHLIDNSIV